MAASTMSTFTLSMSEEERAELLRVLQREFIDTHAERRRTESPEYQQEVGHEESVLHGLLEKVRQLKP